MEIKLCLTNEQITIQHIKKESVWLNNRKHDNSSISYIQQLLSLKNKNNNSIHAYVCNDKSKVYHYCCSTISKLFTTYLSPYKQTYTGCEGTFVNTNVKIIEILFWNQLK